jgi:uncharacterized protein with HEPN domain
MTRDQIRLRLYLEHILEAITRINRYTQDLDRTSFLAHEQIQDAVIRNLEIIGEASRNIETRYPEFKSAHPELPLSAAYQMRNAISHGYFRVDFEIIWTTIKNDLPEFEQKIKIAIKSI